MARPKPVLLPANGDDNRISDGLKTLGNVAKAGKSMLQGLKDAANVVAAGTAFLKAHNFTLHIVTEATSTELLKAELATLTAVGNRHGTESENTVPKVIRSKPFSPVRGMLGLNGERWVPIHGVFALSDAQKVVAANDAYFADKAEFMQKHGVLYSGMSITVGNEFSIAPAFYWTDEITPLHAESVGADVVKPWLDRPANPEARNAVVELRRGCQGLSVRNNLDARNLAIGAGGQEGARSKRPEESRLAGLGALACNTIGQRPITEPVQRFRLRFNVMAERKNPAA